MRIKELNYGHHQFVRLIVQEIEACGYVVEKKGANYCLDHTYRKTICSLGAPLYISNMRVYKEDNSVSLHFDLSYSIIIAHFLVLWVMYGLTAYMSEGQGQSILGLGCIVGYLFINLASIIFLVVVARSEFVGDIKKCIKVS